MTSLAWPSWIRSEKGGLVLLLYVQPGASRTEVVGAHGSPARLKIKVAAPPVDGAANEEVVRFFKKTLKSLGASGVEILRGATSRQKDLWIGELRDPEGLLKLVDQ